MLIRALILASSLTSRRGLASLLPDSLGFEVVEQLDWKTKPSETFEVTLGELGEDDEPLYLVEPFVVLSDRISLEPGPGRGLLHIDSSEESILAALQAVILGLCVQDDFHLVPVAESSKDHDLTPREVDVLNLLGDGSSNRQIANSLHISENTVKFHLSSIFSKLQVSSRAEAVTVGLRNGIIML